MSGEHSGEKRIRTPERDFGDELGKLRYRVNQGKGINQKKIGERVGVSDVTIRNWESGRYRPAPPNLQVLIEVYIEDGGFSPGHEVEEIRSLWEMAEQAGVRAALDEEWLKRLREKYFIAGPGSSEKSMLQDSRLETGLLEDAVRSKLPAIPGGVGNGQSGVASQLEDEGTEQTAELFVRLEQAQELLIDRNRQHMLRRVYRNWIKGVLKESLYNLAPLELGLRDEPGAVAAPWEAPVQGSGSLKNIQQVYDAAEGKLLILGASGSGKSTLLLELTTTLLARAEHDPAHLIPAVFNLSSWSRREQPLTEWLVEELFARYQIPRRLGRQWVEQDRLLLLLDGLDEGSMERLPGLIQAINVYSYEHSVVSIVVCARIADYLDQPERLQLRRAVIVRSLTDQQIDGYLARSGASLQAVSKILHEDEELREVVSTPRMLSILRLASASGPLEDLPRAGSLELRRERIFALYIRRMLERRHTGYPPYEQGQMRDWLAWLTQQLYQHKQSVFYLEGLQMDWLPGWRKYRFYPPVTLGIVYGLVIGLIKAIDYMLIFTSRGMAHALRTGIWDGALIGLVTSIVYILLNSFIFGRQLEREPGQERTAVRLWWDGLYGLLSGVAIGFCTGLLVDVPAGLVNGLFFTLAFSLLGRLSLKIIPAEVIIWSWSHLRRHFLKFVLIGPGIGLIYGLFTGEPYLNQPGKLWLYLFFGLSIGLVSSMLLVCATGLSYGISKKQDSTMPNQGIRNSWRNSLLLALFTGVLAGLIFGLIYWGIVALIFGPHSQTLFPSDGSVAFGVQDGLAVAAFFWLRSGGTTCVQHTLLRALLWSQGCIPWHYTRFLDDASWRTILQKVGGGYIIHQLLLHYLALSREP